MINLILKRTALHLLSSNKISKFNLTQFRFLHNPITNKIEQDSSFTVSYLINSCGLSPQSALSTSRKVQVKNAQGSDSLIQLLKSHEFTDIQITKIVTKYPRLLVMNLEKTAKPKIDYLKSIGYSNREIATLLLSCPCILQSSLETRLRPNFELLISVIGNAQKIATAVRQTSRLLQVNLELYLVPNMHALRSHGVSDLDISNFIWRNPRVILLNHEKFVELVEFVKVKGFNSKLSMFCHGIAAVARLNSWDYKMAFFKSLGWSEEEVNLAFFGHPYIMLVTERKIKKMTDFYSQKFMWGPSVLAKRPILISLSFEKRVLPRSLVLNVLVSKGLVEWKSNVWTFLISSKDFFCKYVAAHMNDVPEVLEVYRRSGATIFNCSKKSTVELKSKGSSKDRQESRTTCKQ